MTALKTDYVDDVLDTSENTTRIYDIVDANGNVIESDIHFEEKTVYSQEGDSYGATEINEQNETINSMNQVIEDLDAEHIAFDDTTAQTGSNNVQGAIEYLKSSFSNALTSLKATDIAQFVGATGSTFASVISALTSVLQTKSVTATTSAQTVSPDSGKVLSSVTVNPQSHSSTRASVTANGTIDLGTTHNIRYVPVSVNGALSAIQRGTRTNVTSTQTITISSVDSTKSFVILDGSNTNSQRSGGPYLISMTNTTITVGVYPYNSEGVTFSWQVVTFSAITRIQRGSGTFTGSTKAITITSVTPSKCLVIVNGHTTDTSRDSSVYLSSLSATTLTIASIGYGTTYYSYQIVEF